MSLSSLQAQLAALQGKAAGGASSSAHAHPGSSYPSSKRHEEAVGRGLHFSVQTGASSSAASTAFKASLLAATAREAADIPVQHLKRNCQAGLQQLVENATTGTINSNNNLDVLAEQICAPNVAPYKTAIQPMLLYLSTVLASQQRQQLHTACWHVLEYLLRRYELHVHHWEDLLWTLWPAATAAAASTSTSNDQQQQHVVVFYRCLQLVDLASHPSYLWLRPYLQQQKTTAESTTPKLPPRQLLAQHVMQRTDLLRRVVRMAKDVATSRSGSSGGDGESVVLSFTAALVVEGLAWWANHNNPSGDDAAAASRSEQLLQTLLPTVLIACRGSNDRNNEDWTGWGYVVASVLAETMPLAPRTVSNLVTTILQPVLQQQQQLDEQQDILMSLASSSSMIPLEQRQADAMAAAMAVLFPPHGATTTTTTTDDDEEETKSHKAGSFFLPLLVPSTTGTSSSNNNDNAVLLGCPVVPTAVRQLLLGHASDVAGALGRLHADRHFVVAPLVAALFVAAVRQQQQKGHDEGDENDNLAVALVQEPRLDSLWRGGADTDRGLDLVATAAAWIVQQQLQSSTNKQHKKQHHSSASLAKTILASLHDMDAAACERGIGRSVSNVLSSSSSQQQDSLQQQLEKLLEGVVPMGGGDDDDDDDDEMSTSSGDRHSGLLLPPRVALEHADAAVRLEALKRLESSLHDKMDVDDDADSNDDDGLVEAFLRRLVSDDNVRVALAACRAVAACSAKGYRIAVASSQQRAVEWILQASYRWMNEVLVLRQTDNETVLELFGEILVVGAQVVAGQQSQRSDGNDGEGQMSEFQFVFVELLVAHLDHSSSAIASRATQALFAAFGRPVKNMTASKMKSAARKLLLEVKAFWTGLPRRFTHRKTTSTEVGLRRKCALVFIDAASSARKGADADMVLLVNSLCLLLLRGLSRPPDEELEVIKKGLKWSVEELSKTGGGEEAVRMIMSLAGSNSGGVFGEAVGPSLEALAASVKDLSGQPVSPLSVLLEAASRPKASASATVRLITIAREFISNEKPAGAWFAVLPALSMLDHSESSVRENAVALLGAISQSLAPKSKKGVSHDWNSLGVLCERVVALSSSSRMGGTSILSQVLSWSVENSEDKKRLQHDLLVLCLFSAASCGNTSASLEADAWKYSWLEMSSAAGGSRVAFHILNAMESSGEKTFSLLSRWKGFAKPILSHALNDEVELRGVPVYWDCIVRMLKGTIVSDPTLIISSGPGSSGRRARSYSFGNVGVSALSPYPKEMSDALVTVLTGVEDRFLQNLSAMIANTVLTSKSWHENVFSNLARATRKKLAQSLLHYVAADSSEVTDDFFSGIPFDCPDLLELLKVSSGDLEHLALLADFVRANSDRLVLDADASKLLMALLDVLLTLASDENGDVKDDGDYVVLSLLLTLTEMWETGIGSLALKSSQLDRFFDATSLMLLGSKDASGSNATQLVSPRARSLVHKLLVVLSDKYPTQSVPRLIEAMLSDVVLVSKRADRGTALAQNTFTRLMPVFLQHAPAAKISLHQMLTEFIAQTDSVADEKQRSQLFHDIAYAMAMGTADRGQAVGELTASTASTGALVASYIAHGLRNSEATSVPFEACEFATEIIAKRRDVVQASSLLLLLQYTKAILSFLQGMEVELDVDSFIPTADGKATIPDLPDVLSYMFGNEISESRDLSKSVSSASYGRLLLLVHAFMKVFTDVLILPAMREYIQNSEGNTSSLSLQLWQDMLVVQSLTQTMGGKTEGSTGSSRWYDVTSIVNESRNSLQEILPVPIFLASASSIIEEGGTDEIKSRALRLVAERSLTLDPDSAERSLFLDLVPLALKILEDDQSSSSVVKISALFAIEHIARALKLQTGRNSGEDQASHFMGALERTSRLLQGAVPALSFTSGPEEQVHELVCSAALCSGALVRVLGARCLPCLRKLVDNLLAYLKLANEQLLDDKVSANAKMAQLSVLRSLIAIVETVPKFVPPFLSSLLSGSGILSTSLRANVEPDIQIRTALERLDLVIATKVPSRLLVPVASKSMQKSSVALEMHPLLSILKTSVDQAPNSEVVAHSKQILLSSTTAFQHSGPFEERSALVKSACFLLHSLVLKLSEIQLRRLFTALMEWRGDIDESQPGIGAEKRYAYWTACAVLSKSLRSIFLPCLAMTMADAVSELEIAVTFMAKDGSAKVSGGKKRRRLENAELFDEDAVRVLQPLLHCLELSLQADAHQGGSWIRSDDNQRYDKLLEPLGKLLQARVPTGILVDSESSPYQQIVLGSGTDGGSVISCLTALASAGGNEQLWKPLNHAVLEACGNESRSDVRKASLSCLLSLMKSLGEEYMVLLPECLPILSELLEDTDEDVCGLSKEIVSFAEELLGESLEDSLM